MSAGATTTAASRLGNVGGGGCYPAIVAFSTSGRGVSERYLEIRHRFECLFVRDVGSDGHAYLRLMEEAVED